MSTSSSWEVIGQEKHNIVHTYLPKPTLIRFLQCLTNCHFNPHRSISLRETSSPTVTNLGCMMQKRGSPECFSEPRWSNVIKIHEYIPCHRHSKVLWCKHQHCTKLKNNMYQIKCTSGLMQASKVMWENCAILSLSLRMCEGFPS